MSIIDFSYSYAKNEPATMISDQKQKEKGKAYAPERRRSLHPTRNTLADVAQDIYIYGFYAAPFLKKTNLLSESSGPEIHNLCIRMQSANPDERPSLGKIIEALKTLLEIDYVPKSQNEGPLIDKPVTTCKSRIKTYAPPLVCATLSSMGLFTSTHFAIPGLGNTYGIIAMLSAHIPAICVVLLCLSIIWLGRNIYVNCISSTNPETPRPISQAI